MEIENEARIFQFEHKEQIEIPVRVLHVIKAKDLHPHKEITFDNYIFPKLFKFYLRYLSWLHVFENKDDAYTQFLNLGDYDTVNNNIAEIIRRLSLGDDEWEKMPRLRDFHLAEWKH